MPSDSALDVERIASIRKAVGCTHVLNIKGLTRTISFEFRHEDRLVASLIYNGAAEYDHEPFYAALEAGLRVECPNAAAPAIGPTEIGGESPAPSTQEDSRGR